MSASDRIVLHGMLSEPQKDRLESIKSPARRDEFLCSRSLMRTALSDFFDHPPGELLFTERRGAAPLITGLPAGVSNSLSHSRGLVFFAIADYRVGIDIENIDRSRNFKLLAEQFMSSAEQDELASGELDPARYFYRCWCIKEAFYKALPPERQAGLSFRRISASALTAGESGWHLFEGDIDGFYVAAVGERKPATIDCRYYTTPALRRQQWALPSRNEPIASVFLNGELAHNPGW